MPKVVKQPAKRQGAKVISLKDLKLRREPIPASWKNAAGLLKDYDIDPVAYQQAVRDEWDERLEEQVQLGSHQK